MTLFRNTRNLHIDRLSTKTPPAKAPVPQVDRDQHAELNRLIKNPSHLDNQFDGDLGGLRNEK